jgi:UDP-4-amino-4-deoxy-L-arabinose-oxoglutarate aminotransferase
MSDRPRGDGDPGPERIDFYRHGVGDEERAAVSAAMADLFLTTGARVAAFERELAAYLGLPTGGALGLSSCTAALHLALLALGVGPGDEVITTPMTFIASSNAILYAGATPVFADVDPATGLLDLAAAEAAITPRTRAILVVHLYGQMVDVTAFRALCDARGLALVEDAAHALEAERDGVRPGALGDAACFSFYATKNITSGEGGALVMRDAARLDRARRLSQHGMSAGAADRHGGTYRHWDMLELGFKCNMTNLQAAMLSPQLRRIDRIHEAREAIAVRYERGLAGVAGLDHPRVAGGAVSAHHLFTIWVPEARRDELLAALPRRGVGVAVNYRAVHLLTFYRERFGFQAGSLPVAERIGASTITLPLWPGLPESAQARVIAEVTSLLDR